LDSFKLTIAILAMFLGTMALGCGFIVHDGFLMFFGMLVLIGSVVALAMSFEKRKLEV
jgi:hypothetical protein